ncbi:hypothetical protein AB0L44_44890 [Nonomuraea wenchangensis]|uniref:hypothetical protein n=1 Tax=Nonomuraea wenchangensis TaxID=568860 RepID=UPI003431B0CA
MGATQNSRHSAATRTASLGGADAATMHDLVRKLSCAGISIVYISHHLDEVLGLADRITVLRDGRRMSRSRTSARSGPARPAELTLTVRAHEVVAVLGPAVDGQSELFDLLGGRRRPSGGRIRVAGADVAAGDHRGAGRPATEHDDGVPAGGQPLSLRRSSTAEE